MKHYYVACVDNFGVYPPVEECDVVPAPSAAVAAELVAKSVNDDCDTFFESQVMAVAKVPPVSALPLKWEHFLVTGTISYTTKPIDVATASKAAAA